MLFMGIIVALSLMTDIINTQDLMTSLQSVVDESTDLSDNGCLNNSGNVNTTNPNCNITVSKWANDWRASESQCALSSVVVTNSSGATLSANTDYVLYASSGIVSMRDTAATKNTTNGNVILVDYSYCDAGYNKDSSSRGIARLISLFAALAILGFVTIGIRNQWFR